MKKLIFLLIILFSVEVLAQTNIANPSTNSKLTAVPANPENWYMEFVDWNNTASPMISVVSFEQLMNLLSISGNQTIEDTWRFNKNLKLPPQAPTVSNEAGFIYQDGLNVYFIQRVWNGTGYDYAAQRLITKSEADSLYALSEAGLDAGYINTSTNQSPIAGNKRTIGIWQFDKIRILGGTTTLPAASEKNQLGIIETGANAGLYRSDASLAWVKISGDGTGGLPSTGSFSGATSSIIFTSGGIRYVSTATGYSATTARAGMPVYSSLPAVTNHYNGDFATVTGETDTDASGSPLHGIYFIYTDQDYNKYWGFVPDQPKVQRMIDKVVKFDPLTITTSTIDLASERNKFIYNSNDNVTFNITNVKNTTFELLVTTQGLTMGFTVPSGYTLKWIDGLVQPSDQGEYKYIFEVWGTTIYAYLGWSY